MQRQLCPQSPFEKELTLTRKENDSGEGVTLRLLTILGTADRVFPCSFYL